MARILVCEDERAIQIALASLLQKRGFEVAVVSTADAAIARIGAERFDLVLTDLALGKGKSGLDVLARVREIERDVPVVLITAHGSEKTAVAAMKGGAADYLPKPFDNDELLLIIERVLQRSGLERDHRLLLERVEREQGLGAIVGSGVAMRRVFSLIEKIAETELGVLVRGESGTGKELVARAIHDRSARKKRPLVAVNCAAMSRDLVESELFGHEKGAFTGADMRRVGRFEQAQGGSLLLDEIGDMPLETQAKVLRVLEQRSLERVGGHTTIEVDVRVIAATHRDLEADVKAGRFREDLYYRLRVLEIVLPPLRERVDDIPALALRVLEELSVKNGRPSPVLSASALAALARHAWPGNVRELKNVLQRAAVLSGRSALEAADLALGEALPRATSADALPLDIVPFAEAKRLASEAFERRYLGLALARQDGNVKRAAESVGMVRQSLQQKMRELGLRRAKEDSEPDE